MTEEPKQVPITSESVDEDLFEQFEKLYQHDAYCKLELKQQGLAKQLVRHLFKENVLEQIDVDNLVVSSESFVDNKLLRSYADVVYTIPFKGSKNTIIVYVLIELKTDNDKWTVFQLLRYVVRIWEREYMNAVESKTLATFMLPTVVPLIFHHGETAFTSPTNVKSLIQLVQGLEQYAVTMEAMLVDLPPSASEDVLPEELELRAFFKVARTVFSKDVMDKMLAIYDELKPHMDEPKYQLQYAKSLYYVLTSSMNFSVGDCKKIVDYIEDERIKNMLTAFDKKLEMIFAEGEAKGKAEGEVTGEAKSILAVLRKRFTTVPNDIESTVCDMSDSIALLSLVTDAMDCNSLDEFRSKLP